MDEVKLQLDENGQGAFVAEEGSKQMGEMVIAISGSELTVYHTEVLPEAEGTGLAKKLLSAMAAYASSNNLQVIPLCPYVSLQFKRHPEVYADIWKKNE